MKRRQLAWIAVVATAAAIAGTPWPHQAETAYSHTPVTPLATASAEAPAGTAGMIVTIDPATGKFSEAPSLAPSSEILESLGEAVSTSGEGLVSQPSKVPGGGVKMHLGGRFQSAMVATVGENGEVQVPCVSGHPDDAAASAGEEK